MDEGFNYEAGSFTTIIFFEVAECEAQLEVMADRPEDAMGTSIAAYPSQGIQVACENGGIELYDFYQDALSDATKFRVSKYRWESGPAGWSLLPSEALEVDKDEMMARPLVDCEGIELPDPRPGS